MSFARRAAPSQRIELLHRYPMRIDLHVVTPQEVAAKSTKPTGFLNSALASGIILYSKRDAPERERLRSHIVAQATMHRVASVTTASALPRS